MTLEKIYSRISPAIQQLEEIKLVFFYRYISLIVTSLFYIIDRSGHSIDRKVFIISCISISSIILNYLYVKNHDSTFKIKILLLIETLGNSLILIPSGGLNSPYVWYALNTILISSIKLKKRYCWVSLFVYLFSSTCILYSIKIVRITPFTALVYEEMNLILSFILITVVIQYLSKHINIIKDKKVKLERANHQLEIANEKNKESMEYVMKLYQAVHLLTSEDNESDLISLIVKYTKQLTRSEIVFFYNLSHSKRNIVFNHEKNNINLEKDINYVLSQEKVEMLKVASTKEITADNKVFVIAPVVSNYKIFGILGIQKITRISDEEENGIINQLKFLSEIGGIVLEKLNLERVNNHLIINEEQKRIADEIHDSTLQRLFAISCGLTALTKAFENSRTYELTDELQVIRNSLNKTMKELRATVYGLNWKKTGINWFITDINNYINEVIKLNHVNINFEVQGNTDFLSSQQKNALYRVVSEGISNAVRHGKSSSIVIELIIKASTTSLKIIDNGIGFNYEKIRKEQKLGLGLGNIEYLINSLNGKILFFSDIEKGTEINITIPNKYYLNKEEIV
ncbi:MAG: hypothetical protein FH761_13505 [Firmicutes bacterium]|nr:hypothetical protein [Bacillota bacterium]